MANSPLVSTEWLEAHLDDPKVRILEVCSLTSDEKYRAGHIPGASWVFWKAACWHASDREFVTPEAMAKLFAELGIGPDTTLVLYGDPVQYGTYGYWAFSMAGHKDLRVLDGGRTKWTAEKRPMSTEVPKPTAVAYPPPAANKETRVGRRNVLNQLGKPGRVLIDVRSPEEYTGKRVIEYSAAFDHGAERTGRIPGAKHLYYKDVINADDSYKSADVIRARMAELGLTPEDAPEIVCYCRLSHRATLVWTALTHVAGFKGVKIYDGSWTEWGSIVGYPIEK